MDLLQPSSGLLPTIFFLYMVSYCFFISLRSVNCFSVLPFALPVFQLYIIIFQFDLEETVR